MHARLSDCLHVSKWAIDEMPKTTTDRRGTKPAGRRDGGETSKSDRVDSSSPNGQRAGCIGTDAIGSETCLTPMKLSAIRNIH